MKKIIHKLKEQLPGQGGEVPVYHIAGMARCGETILLRTLAAHENIHVVHNLSASDTPEELKLFNFLMRYSGTTLPVKHRLLRHLNVSAGDCLVLKQGVWEHRYSFMGIVFARNPVSVYASLKSYDYELEDISGWDKNMERLLRWMNEIDRSLVDALKQLSPIQQFCLFYNRRMIPLAQSGLPLFRYEEFVSDPTGVLKNIMATFKLDGDERMMESHRLYRRQTRGHGGTDLSKAINPHSLNKYKEIITPDEFYEIREATADVCGILGYVLNWDGIELSIPT